MFEQYFKTAENRCRFEKSILSTKRLDGSEQETAVLEFLSFDKRKFLTEIAGRINSANLTGYTEPTLNGDGFAQTMTAMGLQVIRCVVYNKNTILFFIELDVTTSTVLWGLSEVNFSFFFIDEEENLRYKLQPQYKKEHPKYKENLLQPDVDLNNFSNLWVFEVSKTVFT